MKLWVKAAIAFAAWTAILLSILCGPARAAGMVQQQPPRRLGTQDSWVLEFDWTGDAVTGSVPNTLVSLSGCDGLCQGYLITQIETIPKSPSPSSGYGVAFNDQGGADIFGGSVIGLSNTAAQTFPPISSATPIVGSPILVISSQTNAGAQGTILIFLRKPGPISPVSVGSQPSPNWLTIANAPFFDTRVYNWNPQSPSGILTAGVQATVAMRPCPKGLPSPITTASNYFAYISGTGTPEPVLAVTTSSCTSGGTGTLVFTPRYSHSAGWTIGPASFGWQEANWAAEAGGAGVIQLPPGSLTLHAPVYFPTVNSVELGQRVVVNGAGTTNTLITTDLDPTNPTLTIWVANNCGSGSSPCLALTTSGENSTTVLNVTGAANNGSGLIRLAFANHTYQDEDVIQVATVGGVPNATGVWHAKFVDGTHVDLQGSTFAGAYTSGGTAQRYLQAVLLVNNGDKAPLFTNFRLSLPQLSAPAGIANIIQHPPAIYARGSFGLDVDHVMIDRTWNGIDLGGIWSGSTWSAFSGRARISNVDLSSFRHGFQIDGAGDFIRILGSQFWPFYAMTSQQLSVWANDTNILGVWAGRADGLFLSDGVLLYHHGADYHLGFGSGSTFGGITDTGFDGIMNGLNISAATLSLKGGYVTTGSGCSTPSITMGGGSLTMTSMWLNDFGPCTQPFISTSGGTLSVVGNNFARSAGGAGTVPADISSTSITQLVVNGNNFFRDGTLNWVNPFIDCEGAFAICTITNNRAGGLTTGSGVFVKIGSDYYDLVTGNVAPGWTMSFPASPLKGYYEDAPGQQHPVTFVNLPVSANGRSLYCSDCNATCTANLGSGRTCFRENNTWTH